MTDRRARLVGQSCVERDEGEKAREKGKVKSLLFASKKSCSIIVHLLLIITIADYQLFCRRAPPKENKQNGLQPRGEFHRFLLFTKTKSFNCHWIKE